METRKSIQQIWQQHESGLLIPAGMFTDLSLFSSETYLRIKEKAKAIEQLYSDSNVQLPATSSLAGLIGDAKALSDGWFMNGAEELSNTLLFRVCHLDRIADAVLPLREVPARTKFLSALASGSLDLLERVNSNAKSTLWELELWVALRERSFDVALSEPPDIVVTFEDAKVGIACKKFYSEKHVQNVLSEAVQQIETSFDFGIVAANIDDLLPANQLLQAPTHESMKEMIREFNNRFLVTHDRHFRKYLTSGRMLSALVSTAALADVSRANPRLNNVRRSTVWTIPGLPTEKERQLKRFYGLLME